VALIGAAVGVAEDAPTVSLAAFMLAFLVGLIQDLKNLKNPFINSITATLAVVAGIVASMIGVTFEDFLERLLSALLVIISIKLISPKKSRDIYQLYLLNLLLVAAATVVKLGLDFAVLLIVETFISITGVIFTFASGQYPEIPKQHAWSLVRWSGFITVGLLPMTIVLFLILPRPSSSFLAWGIGATHTTGFSDTVQLGSVESIKLDSSPAFRVKWNKGQRPTRALWRGVVYDTYYQGNWYKSLKHTIPHTPKLANDSIEYELLIEPTSSKYLFTYGLPFRVYQATYEPSLTTGYTLELENAMRRRSFFLIKAYGLSTFPEDVPVKDYLTLNLPGNMKEKIQNMAQRLKRPSAVETAQAVQAFLRANYAYTLSPGYPTGEPVHYFLFDNKKGHCEYFASAMAIMLRTLDIPARVVGGYLEGEWNEYGQFYLVLQSDAHTWVEAWDSDLGWVTFDPTPPASNTSLLAISKKLSNVFGYLQMSWYYWVLKFDVSRQMELANKSMQFYQTVKHKKKEIHFDFLKMNASYLFLILLAAMLFTLGVFGRSYWRSRPKTIGERFVRVFASAGLHKEPGQTLKEFAKTLSGHDKFKNAAQKTAQFISLYHLVEYNQNDEYYQKLERLLEEIKRELKR
jgi:transglutaminase-like putative cysteine protease